MDVLMEGIVFGEPPRWRDGRLWFSDWGVGRVFSIAADGSILVEAELASFPMCIDFLPDGQLIVVSSADRQVMRRETDRSLVPHADLAPTSTKPWYDTVVDGRGNAYVNSIGFAFPGEEPAPGIVVLVRPDGQVVPVADGLAFPNGMAITSDDGTLVVAESYGERLTAYDVADDGTLSGRRVQAATPGDHPDGICLDVTGALWYADVGNRHCVRVREGGEVLATVDLDRGAFACALSSGDDPKLFVVGQDWAGPDAVRGATGQIVAFPAPAPRDGHPQTYPGPGSSTGLYAEDGNFGVGHIRCQHEGMPNRLSGITIDCADPGSLAAFWSMLLDRPFSVEHDGPGWATVGSRLDPLPRLTFQRVPEARSVGP